MTDQTPTEHKVKVPDLGEAKELIQSLTPRLSEEDEQELANLIVSDYHAALQDRVEWEARLVEWNDQYYGRLPEKTFPWPGAANFHVPLTMMGIETYKPRLVESVLGQTPPLIVVPVQSADVERRDRVETFLNWQITAELNLEPVVTQSAHLFLLPGIVIAKTFWNVQRVQRKFVREFPITTSVDSIFETLFGNRKPSDLTSTGELKWKGTIPSSPQGGEPLDVKVEVNIFEESIQVLLEKQELIEQPGVDLLEPIDFITPAHGGHDVQQFPWCQHRLWLTENQLRKKVQLGRFYADRVQELIDNVKVPMGSMQAQDATAYKQSQAAAEGIRDEGPSDVRRHQYEILEDYRSYDIDDDGFDEEIITWQAPKLDGKILGWDYLDNVYAHGRRPFRVGRFFPIPFRFYPLSFPEVVRDIQNEINTIHNQRVDYGTITNLPFYFYPASNTAFAPIQQRIRPGEGIPVDNPNSVVFPKWSSSPGWGHSEETVLHQYFERLTGLTDLTLGRMPNRVGATRTAAGTQTLLQEANLRYKIAMQAFQRFWIGVFEDILALNQEYLPMGKEFRVTGKRPEFIRLKDRSEIRGRFDIRLAATSETLNRQQMRNDSAIVMQTLMSPALLQVGEVGIKGIRRSLEDFLKAFGRDPDFYLEQTSVIRSPEEELALFVSGVPVVPNSREDLQSHLRVHQSQLQDPAIQPYLSVEARQLLTRHIQDTLQLLKSQQLSQALQATTQGGSAPLQGSQEIVGKAAPQGVPSQTTNLMTEGTASGVK